MALVVIIGNVSDCEASGDNRYKITVAESVPVWNRDTRSNDYEKRYWSMFIDGDKQSGFLDRLDKTRKGTSVQVIGTMKVVPGKEGKLFYNVEFPTLTINTTMDWNKSKGSTPEQSNPPNQERELPPVDTEKDPFADEESKAVLDPKPRRTWNT